MNPPFKRTGVFASEDECKELVALMQRAQLTPVMAMSLSEGLAGNDWSAQAWKRFYKRLGGVAESNSLPHLPGEEVYGLDGSNGEFLKLPDG